MFFFACFSLFLLVTSSCIKRAPGACVCILSNLASHTRQDTLVQSILEGERVVVKDPSPFAAPHLRIGAVVVVNGLQSEGYKRFNGTQAMVLGDNPNGRILIDLPEKSLLVKRENLTLVFGTPALDQRFSGSVGADAAAPAFSAQGNLAQDQKPAAEKKQKTFNAAQAAAQRVAQYQRDSGAAPGPARPHAFEKAEGAVPAPLKAETPVKTVNSNAKKGSSKVDGKPGREGGALQAAKAVVNLAPVLNTAPAKDVVQEEVGVCTRSGTVIVVGDDYVTLSCSARCGPTLLKVLRPTCPCRQGVLPGLPSCDCLAGTA